MERKIRVGAVSYLNTKPLVYGFAKEGIPDNMILTSDYPAKVAAGLINDDLDIGLIPVAVIPKLKEHYIISDFCIGASSSVASVCVFSEVPIDKVTHLLVDYQSRTSAALTKILVKHWWKIHPILVDTTGHFQDQIKGTTAGLVIGDRALVQREKSTYIYDLADEWRAFTGLPFLFAAWIANKKLPDNFIEQFNRINSIGFEHLPEVVAENPFPAYDLMEYYTKNIDYKLDNEKRQALELFLDYVRKDGL